MKNRAGRGLLHRHDAPPRISDPAIIARQQIGRAGRGETPSVRSETRHPQDRLTGRTVECQTGSAAGQRRQRFNFPGGFKTVGLRNENLPAATFIRQIGVNVDDGVALNSRIVAKPPPDCSSNAR